MARGAKTGDVGSAIISFAIGIYIMTGVLPGAIMSAIEANVTGWPAALVGLWGLVSVLSVIGGVWLLWKSIRG